MGFMLGSTCSPCCGCQPCPRCAPICLTATFSGFAHGTGNCGECDFLDDTTFVLRRPPDPTLSVTATVPSATGSGATFSVTTARNATDGSYAVTGIKLTNGGANYSLGDAMTFSSNGCIVEPPSASITIATTLPVATSLQVTPAVVPSGMAITSVPVTYEQQADEDGNPYWRVASIGSPFYGLGYSEGMSVSLTPGIPSGSSNPESGVVIQEAATATITQTNRIAPTLQVRIARTGGGTFNAQTVSLTQGTDANGREVWSVSSVSVGWWFPSDFTPSDTVSFVTVGDTATVVQAATATMTVDENGAITGFTVTSGGQYYDTQGRPLAIELLTAGAYYKPGVITGVTLADGGKIFAPNSCRYTSDKVCAVCAEFAGQQTYAAVVLGEAEHSLTIYRGDAILLQAARPSVDNSGNPISCDGLTFEPEHFSEQYSCMTNGTVTVAEGECGDSSRYACDPPEQVTFETSGVGPIFLWSSQGGGFPPEDPFDGQCDLSFNCFLRGAGIAIGPSLWGGYLLQDWSQVFDLQPTCPISYTGPGVAQPSSGGPSGGVSQDRIDCGGYASQVGPAPFGISPANLGTNVTISGPSWGSYGATAEASVSGGAVTAITVTNPGEGYAREIFERTEPSMTVSLSGGTGSGAVLSATLAQSGTGENATWYVSDVTVADGGTGHSGLEAVVFTPEDGATVESAASAVVLVGRTEPTVAASVSGGSGADFSVTLAVSTDWMTGQDSWYVDSVSVDDGGTGYADGASVTFTVTDGVQALAASATVTTGREEPEVTAAVPYSSGSGAVLTPVLSASGSSWTVASITIGNGGSGYSQWDQVVISTGDVEESGSYFYVSSIDGSGAITGIGSYGGGSYYRSNGIVESVAVNSGGSYYKSNGIIESVLIDNGGSYYISESTGTADVDTPEVTISSNIGRGATATATVDATLGSPTFGQITGVMVVSGGEEYRLSGTGWILAFNIPGFFHADQLRNVFGYDASVCSNIDDYAEEVYARVTADACPNSLLNRSYKMFYVAGSPFGVDSACGKFCEIPSPSNDVAVFTSFGSGDIVFTLS